MRVVTLNVNGIRSAASKGLYRWLAAQKADVVCLQEIKAEEADLDAAMLAPKGLHGYFYPAQKKGYAGVALYSGRQPEAVVKGFGVREFDAEGRYLEATFGRLKVVSLYLPSGSSGEHRQESKFRFLEVFVPHLRKLARCGHDRCTRERERDFGRETGHASRY